MRNVAYFPCCELCLSLEYVEQGRIRDAPSFRAIDNEQGVEKALRFPVALLSSPFFSFSLCLKPGTTRCGESRKRCKTARGHRYNTKKTRDVVDINPCIVVTSPPSDAAGFKPASVFSPYTQVFVDMSPPDTSQLVEKQRRVLLLSERRSGAGTVGKVFNADPNIFYVGDPCRMGGGPEALFGDACSMMVSRLLACQPTTNDVRNLYSFSYIVGQV